jgi:Flp pilus assembly protein TadB
MATWPSVVRTNPLRTLLGVAIASFVAWFVVMQLGPIALFAVAAIVITCGAVARRMGMTRKAHARAAADPFTFADVVARLHARERAEAILVDQRRAAYAAAR